MDYVNRERRRAVLRAIPVRLPPQMQLEIPTPLDDSLPHIQFMLYGRWPDVRDPGQSIGTYWTFAIEDYIPDDMLATVFKVELQDAVQTLWNHELKEWFLIDNEHALGKPHMEDGSFA